MLIWLPIYLQSVRFFLLNRVRVTCMVSVRVGYAYMSTQRESFEGQNGGRPSEAEGGGSGGPPPEIKKKTVLQMVQSEVFLSYIYEYN